MWTHRSRQRRTTPGLGTRLRRWWEGLSLPPDDPVEAPPPQRAAPPDRHERDAPPPPAAAAAPGERTAS
jgi:hypothetical protein